MIQQRMTQLEHKDAANALVSWFNSQDINPMDAKIIMRMLLAKVIIDTTTDLIQIADILKSFNFDLASDMANYLKHKETRTPRSPPK